MADDDDLMRWAETCSPWGDEPAQFIRYARWLISEATPDEMHVAATNWNWDYGEEPLFWVIRNPRCDKATALAIFFLTEVMQSWPPELEPLDEAAILAASEQEVRGLHDLGREIRARFARGFYTRSEIAYDPSNDIRLTGGDRVAALLPAVMHEALTGRSLPDTIRGQGIADGLPLALEADGER